MPAITKVTRSTESLCEMFFVPREEWDMTIPGIVYQGVKEKFPIKKQEIGGGFSSDASGMGTPRIMFFNENQDMVVQVGANLLTINMFKPNIKWAYFKQLIKYSLYQYNEAAGPQEFEKVGLRYINKFDISDTPDNLDRYLTLCPKLPKESPQRFVEHEMNFRINYRDNRDFIVFHSDISDISEENKRFSLMLDVNFCMDNPGELQLNHLGKWLDSAHFELNRLFLNSLTDTMKRLFGIRDSESGAL